ncbi:hypothetical protein PIB30_108179, partial [Stylosanthes scabra]|nr:hypothetical protein [Stylosanthes scabra]
MIASETDAKATGSSPTLQDSRRKCGKCPRGQWEAGLSTTRSRSVRSTRTPDERANSDLAVVKTRRYHFNDRPFIHPLYSIRFDPDHPYELPVKSLLTLRHRDPSKKKDSYPQESGQEGARQLNSWELIPPSEGWMCEGNDVEGKRASEEVPERVDDAKGIEKG